MLTLAVKVREITASARQVPFIEKPEDVASDVILQETGTLLPPSLVSTLPPPVHCPSMDFRKSCSAANAPDEAKTAPASAMAKRARMIKILSG